MVCIVTLEIPKYGSAASCPHHKGSLFYTDLPLCVVQIIHYWLKACHLMSNRLNNDVLTRCTAYVIHAARIVSSDYPL